MVLQTLAVEFPKLPQSQVDDLLRLRSGGCGGRGGSPPSTHTLLEPPAASQQEDKK